MTARHSFSEDHSIQHVSDTAVWVAAYRAMETERPDALFRDPLAARLAGERGHRIAAKMKSGSMIQWAVVIRTCIIDDLLSSAIAGGIDTVLNLGSGLDTRPYRMALPRELHWIEVDYPHVQDFKAERLAGETPHCQLERVSLDLSDRPARQALLEKIAGSAQRVAVLTEGVTPYLANDEVGRLADDLRAHPQFQLWINDYMASGRTRMRRMRRQLRNAPLQFKPENWVDFFASHHWRVREFRYYSEEGAKHGRYPRLPWWMRFIIAISPRERVEEMRRMAGYAVLTPDS
jgi:methyltransferase (TIGR00027 family)